MQIKQDNYYEFSTEVMATLGQKLLSKTRKELGGRLSFLVKIIVMAARKILSVPHTHNDHRLRFRRTSNPIEIEVNHFWQGDDSIHTQIYLLF